MNTSPSMSQTVLKVAGISKRFAEIQQGEDFISPEGSLCKKLTSTKAEMRDNEDGAYKYGDIVSFNPEDIVEPV